LNGPMTDSGTLLSHDWYPRPVPANVVVGARSWVHSAFAFLHCRSQRPVAVSIGHDTGIYIGTMFCLGREASVEIGNFGTLTSVILSTGGRIVIGDHSLISVRVVLADSWAAAGPDVTMHGAGENKDIVIGENVWIGANAIVLGGARIGDNAIIGAGAVVDFEVPANAIVAGNPARIVGSLRADK